MRFDFSEGEILLVDKPLEWTSFDVVKKLKNLITKRKEPNSSQERKAKIKLGHAGTLDPLASGLLILCSGKKTKMISQIQEQEKEYIAEFFLGATTPTYDLESEPENFSNIENISSSDIELLSKKMIGKQDQMPPIFSAKKVKGVRAYELARRGKEVDLKPNTIEVYDFEILNISLPLVEVRIRCSKGTYIRSIAHDFGQELKVGAYLNRLRRTKIGEYKVENAFSISQWEEALRQD